MNRGEVVEAWKYAKWTLEVQRLAIIKASDPKDLEFTLWHLGYEPTPLQLARILAEADSGQKLDDIVRREFP